MSATSFRPGLLLSIYVAAAASGCPAAPAGGMPCDVDTDCAAGEYCMGGGVGCTFDCRTDVDCLASGGGACTARGRCEGTAPDAGPRDGAPPPRDSAGPCGADADCDDGVFCNGREICSASTCASGAAPCTAAACDEAADRCRVTDADGDGDPSTSDCDDADATRYTGNLAEMNRCDAIDNDCDPTTLGPDGDRDGDALEGCCNPQTDGTTLCGSDCDDARDFISNHGIESCNAFDDDCDGTTDEMVETTYYVDADGDGYGSDDLGLTTMMGCVPPLGFATTADDCDDRVSIGRASHPGATERCDLDMLDEDCDGSQNEGCLCPVEGTTRPCCSGRGTETCAMTPPEGATWSECSVGSATEICNLIDDDCDGTADELPTEICPEVTGQTCVGGACVCPSGTVACGGSCQAVGLQCDGTDTDSCLEGTTSCDGSGTVVCSDTTPSTTDTCNRSDDDCDGAIDEGASAICDAGVPGQFCNGAGTCVCAAGSTVCNNRCQSVPGGMCDGTDADACQDGIYACNGTSVACNDGPGDNGTTVRQCGTDPDCDGNSYENLAATDCLPGATRTCDACPGIFTSYGVFETVNQSCTGSTCTWPTCERTRGSGAITGINSPAAQAPWSRPLCCTGPVSSPDGYRVDMAASGPSGCGPDYEMVWLYGLSLPPGEYRLTFEHYDSAVFVTPRMRLAVDGATIVTPSIFNNTVGGYETMNMSFTVGGCASVNIRFYSIYSFYDGSAGGVPPGCYRGGDGIGRIQIYGPY